MKAEPLAKMFSIAGVDATFESFTVKVVPLFDTTVLYGEPTTYAVERTDFMFHIQTSEVKAKELEEDMEFSITDGSYVYLMQIERIVPDLTGVSQLNTIFKERLDV